MPFGLTETEWERLQLLDRRKPVTPRRQAMRRREVVSRAVMLTRMEQAAAMASVYPDSERKRWIYRQMGLEYPSDE